MACLIELHNKQFLNNINYYKYIELIQSSLLTVTDFGRCIKGKHSVTLYLQKGHNTEQIIDFANQINKFIKFQIINDIDFKWQNYDIKLVKPLLSDICETSNFYEPDEPLTLKFICESYEKKEFQKVKKKDISQLPIIKSITESSLCNYLKRVAKKIDYAMCNDIRRLHLCRQCYNTGCSNATGIHYAAKPKKFDLNDKSICPDFVYSIVRRTPYVQRPMPPQPICTRG